jgi:hypothetical protein
MGDAPMDRERRRFGLGDLMILIAALAAGMQGARGLWRLQVEGPRGPSWSLTPTRLMVAAVAASIAAPMTIAVLALRLRRPRPARRRIWTQPGAAAALACALMFAVKGIEVVAAFAWPDTLSRGAATIRQAARVRVNDSTYLLYLSAPALNGVIGSVGLGCWDVAMAAFAAPCGYSVGAVWLLLVLSGRWRAERSWIDRLGRLLGVVWIAAAVAAAIPV